MTRIISGKYRGRRINAPKSLPVRPTTDRAKESLFNILYNQFDFSETVALDLFSGTGNLSFELASRGCPLVVSVDQNRKCCSFISETAAALEMNQLEVITSAAEEFLRRANRRFDLIVADPPYDYQGYSELVGQILEKERLSDNGLLVIEHDSRIKLDQLPGFREVRKYGNSSFSFFGLAED